MIFVQEARKQEVPLHTLCAYPEICYCPCARCEHERAQYYAKDFTDEA